MTKINAELHSIRWGEEMEKKCFDTVQTGWALLKGTWGVKTKKNYGY